MDARRLLAPASVVSLLLVAAAACTSWRADGFESVTFDPERGEVLYARYCASCHGIDGAGDGPGSPYLRPPARDFRSGAFHLVSTDNGNPSMRDLLRTLREGMPGSTMPAWDWMPTEDLYGLAHHVRRLAVDGRADELIADARREGLDLSIERAEELAEWELRPGALLGAGTPPPETDELLARGEALYLDRCAACHGADGKGGPPRPYWNDDLTPNRPRDFTSGLMKGGITKEGIVDRILCGMPGTPMPATLLDDVGDAWAIAAYVRGMIQAEDWIWALQDSRGVPVARTEALPAAIDDGFWDSARAVWLPLMPLWWDDDRTDRAWGVYVRAAHDGERIALLVTWSDGTQDDRLLGDTPFPDALALMFSRDEIPPVFAMGAEWSPVEIWEWKAIWPAEAMGELDLTEPRPVPHTTDVFGEVESRADVPVYRIGGRVQDGDDEDDVRVLTGTGPGRIHLPPEPREDFRMSARWSDGSWHVLVVRPIEDAGAELASLALAVWDGSAGDAGPTKSVTIWHQLAIERPR